jgi:hypothetical protein
LQEEALTGLITRGVAGKAIYRRSFVPATLLVLCIFSYSSVIFAEELVVNGGFEEPVVPHEKGWATYYGQNGAGKCEENGEEECNEGVLVPGWEVFWTDLIVGPQILEPGRLELQNNSVPDLPDAKSGEQKAELDSHHRAASDDNNATILQFIPTCPRSAYTLTYAWRSRTEILNDNDIRVIVKDSIVREHTINAEWDIEEVNFVSDDLCETPIAFASIGDNTTFGGFVDDISVTGPACRTTASCENRAEPTSICEDGKPKSLTLLYDGNAFTQHGQDSNEVIITEPTGEFPNPALVRVYGHKKKSPELLLTKTLAWGETFDVVGPHNRIPPRLKFEIINPENDEIIQTVQFHTSCSQPLAALDEFGGITVWAADVIADSKITPEKRSLD